MAGRQLSRSAAAAAPARWIAGRYGDRHGPARLVLPGLLVSAAGLLAGRTGCPLAFALTAALMLTALAPALRDRPACDRPTVG